MEDYMITFKYEFESGIGEMEGGRYIREFKMSIFSLEDTESEKLIGKVEFKIVYLDQAMESEFDFYDIFDSYEYTNRIAQVFFDFKTGDIKEKVQKFYNYELIGSNICILERIEILPEFRGHKIAAKAIKDIIFHFESSCGLFVIQAYPLQFEPDERKKDDWQEQLHLNSFPSNEKIAIKQLRTYYKSFGFDEIPGCKDLLFYNPALINKKMDSINLEE